MAPSRNQPAAASRSADDPPPRHRLPMRIGVHLLLSTIVQAAGFIAGACLMVFLAPDEFRAKIGILFFGFLVMSSVGLRFAARAGMRRLAARCPQCMGAAFQRGNKPIRYECSACGHVHPTTISTNF